MLRAKTSAMALSLLAVVPIACHRGGDGLVAASVRVEPGVTYSLDDGEQRHREAPDTFKIPSLAARQALVPGQIVKLMFNITKDGESQVERMWVVVEDKDAHGYVGALDNRPVTTDMMRPGMKVHFQPRHVINIHPKRAGDTPAGSTGR